MITQGLMHKKINIWLSLLIILVIAAAAAWTISVNAVLGSGFQIISMPKPCIFNSIDGNCLASCPICGDTAICNGVSEIQAKHIGGSPVLYKQAALCVPKGSRPNYGSFTPGAKCIGNFNTLYPPAHSWSSLGCSR